MTVHFPLAFAIAVPVFALLGRLTGLPAFAATAHHCLWALFLSAPVAIVTGFVSWKVNYLGKPLRPVQRKKPLAFLLWGVSGGLLAWGRLDPGAADGTLYLLLAGGLAALAFALGWFGGELTFPVGER
jgi:hypothetical protein